MKDNIVPCHHTFTDDVVYKEVVIIGNGPSGMVTSFMLAGNVPYLKEIPDDLPIDDMLRARLSNIPAGQSLYETDLMELAEGLEGRSQNPIPLLTDNLLRPCADLGIQADSLVEWRYDVEKQIDHIVLGRGPPGGAWHTFPAEVRTLSPGAWLSLPPHSDAGMGRLSARAVAKYCRRYVHACKLQKYFRSGVVVTSVRACSRNTRRCSVRCPLNTRFVVSGYDISESRPFRYVCGRVVVACGGGDRPNTLDPQVASRALHSLSDVERSVRALAAQASPAPVLIVGSGVSAADAVCLCRGAGLRAHHVYRAPADALAKLPPADYPDYCQVYKMMCDGPSGNYTNYIPYPEHAVIEVTPLTHKHVEDDAIRLKRVKLLNLVTNEITEVNISLITVLIGSKPDLFFLQTNFDLNCIDVCKCTENDKVTIDKCITIENYMDIDKKLSKRKITDQRQCFLKNHWYYLKSILGQSIQSCKSRYLNYTEINGNDTKCPQKDCNKIRNLTIIENGGMKTVDNTIDNECENPYSGGIGYGIDPKKPVDCRGNPVAIDKSTHELLYAPKGMYALGPITADNFVRFIPGGALAILSHMHKGRKTDLP